MSRCNCTAAVECNRTTSCMSEMHLQSIEVQLRHESQQSQQYIWMVRLRLHSAQLHENTWTQDGRRQIHSFQQLFLLSHTCEPSPVSFFKLRFPRISTSWPRYRISDVNNPTPKVRSAERHFSPAPHGVVTFDRLIEVFLRSNTISQTLPRRALVSFNAPDGLIIC